MGGWWAAASTYAAAYSLSASVTKPRKPWRLDLRYFMIDSRSCPAAIFGSQKSSIGSFTCSEYWKGRGPVVNEVGERMDGLVSSVCPTIHVVLLCGIYLFFPYFFSRWFVSSLVLLEICIAIINNMKRFLLLVVQILPALAFVPMTPSPLRPSPPIGPETPAAIRPRLPAGTFLATAGDDPPLDPPSSTRRTSATS